MSLGKEANQALTSEGKMTTDDAKDAASELLAMHRTLDGQSYSDMKRADIDGDGKVSQAEQLRFEASNKINSDVADQIKATAEQLQSKKVESTSKAADGSADQTATAKNKVVELMIHAVESIPEFMQLKAHGASAANSSGNP